ncbi:stearoyl-CoA 9-desaturase, partial [Streptomyces rubellomurinus subsp. indigoferus]
MHTDTDGRLDVARLGELVPDWAERQAWACGPAGLPDAPEQPCAEHGAQARPPPDRLRPRLTVAGDGSGSGDGSGADTAGGEVTFSRTAKAVDTDGTTPLPDVGEDSGVP